MKKRDDLIEENEILKKKLALAEIWMRREIAHQKKSLSEAETKKSGRRKLDNILERDSVDIITRRIQGYFGASLENAPKYTLEHLIDAEIYWQTLQKFPTLDALPVVSSYQKILDAFFESILSDFRTRHSECNEESRRLLKPGLLRTSQWHRQHTLNSLDRDIENVLSKKYTLSLGRWFQFFQKVREGSDFGWKYEDMLLEYLSENHESLLEICVTDPFFSGFSELISLEVFSRKRHDNKISYADAKRVREICVDWYLKKGILKNILESWF
jgi:hypothetical protein